VDAQVCYTAAGGGGSMGAAPHAVVSVSKLGEPRPELVVQFLLHSYLCSFTSVFTPNDAPLPSVRAALISSNAVAAERGFFPNGSHVRKSPGKESENAAA